jgi:hypothetical protein
MRLRLLAAVMTVTILWRVLPSEAAVVTNVTAPSIPVIVVPQTVTIDTLVAFDQLAGPHRAPFSGLVTNGYRLTALSGNWRQIDDGRAGAPALLVQNVARGDPHVLEISREDGAPFRLLGFDIEGFGVYTEIRSWRGGMLNSIGGFFPSGTVSSLSFAGDLDRLTIGFTAAGRGVTVALDDILLRQVLPVPEPSGAVLYAAGLLAILGTGALRRSGIAEPDACLPKPGCRGNA